MIKFYSAVFLSLVVLIPAAMSGNDSWNPCNQPLKTAEQKKKCSLFNEKSEHYRKLDDAVKGIGNTVREPIRVPDGVRRQQQYQQHYIK